MPNRIIKESICTSDTLDALSWFDEVVFYRLLVNCDDYGCFDARPSILKASLFPLKEDKLTSEQVMDAVKRLAEVKLLQLYTVEGKPFLKLRTWASHQRIRTSKKKFPWPDDADPETDCENSPQVAASCGEMPPSRARAESNPIQSESESNSNPNPNPNPKEPADKPPDAFDLFWKAYPKKVGKEDARKKFKKVKVPVETLIAAIDRQKKSVQWTKENGQYIPNPATWLNQGRWEDELQGGESLGAHTECSTQNQFGNII